MKMIILGAIGAGVFLATRADEAGQGSEAPRGIRNNNPGNLEHGANWQGMAEDQSGDTRFIRFVSPVWGIRAMARVLNVYRNRDGIGGLGGPGIDTIAEIIPRWAPGFENNVQAYVRSVADSARIDPGQVLMAGDYPAVIKAMIQHENGVQPYPDSIISEGIARAKA